MAQFNPLTGSELLDVIIADIRKTAEESGEFSNNLTFPWVKYTYSLKVTSYPKNAPEAEPVEVAKGEGTVPAGEPGPLDIQAEDTSIVELAPESPVIIDIPDQARVDADLPLPTPVPVANVGIVDKPVKQAQAKRGK